LSYGRLTSLAIVATARVRPQRLCGKFAAGPPLVWRQRRPLVRGAGLGV